MSAVAARDASSPRVAWTVLRALGVLAVAAVAVLAYLRFAPRPKALAVVGHVPAFQLVDQRGAPFTDADLRGHVWVADFFFTGCSSTCPRLAARMHRLQEILDKEGRPVDVRLVSFSVDPENDPPETLAKYAASVHADPGRWSFLTGPSDAVQKAVVQGFKMTAEREPNGNVLHGNWFVLGDRAGDIRGYYDVEEEASVDALAKDVLRLEREGR